ncbi:MAG: hypothetical protein JSW10_01045 [Pseudomonadota bacterium]|nr:MAG: hypothetical protein JSW10_01045 [Pseudomonadota bacterium]
MNDSDEITQCIDALCIKGCDAVRIALDLLRQGRSLKETAALSPDQVATVQRELEEIMAVYDSDRD